MKHIRVLGITGGVGAGKSTILAYLKTRYQARVIELDQVARMLQQKGRSCYDDIVKAFGTEILGPDGEIDRQALFQAAFHDPARVVLLNSLVHPAVKEYIRKEIADEENRQQNKLIVLEAALLLEDHYEEICDGIWYIYVDPAVRYARLRESRGYSDEKTAGILANQKSDEEFRNACQFVVDNSSDILENTYEQIDKGLRLYGFL